MTMTTAAARELAHEALVFLASDDQFVTGFLAATGLQAGDLRASASSPAFLGDLLGFLCESDVRVLDFARSAGIRPEEVMVAHALLSGPGSHGWQID